MTEHEIYMKNYLYRKGYEYVFDHYGISRLPYEKFEDTLKQLDNVEKELAATKIRLEKFKEEHKKVLRSSKQLKTTLKATRQSWYYQTSVSKKLRKQIKTVKSKWYLKPFNKLIWKTK